MSMPPWKHRRRLVYATTALGGLMILAGIAATFTDYAVATQLVVGGVAIVTIPLGAYVGAATFEDVRLWPEHKEQGDPYD